MPERRTTALGSTAVTVTDLGFGGSAIGNLGRRVDDETARSAVAAAWAVGVRYFDTAPHYGLGLSERRLGEALAGRPRTEYAISTKVGRLLVPAGDRVGSDLEAGGFDVPATARRVFDFSRDGVRRSLEASLSRLGLDRVDVALVHDPDTPVHAETALREALPALAELRAEGVVGAVGLGMNSWTTPLRAVREADVDVVMVAGCWTLLRPDAGELLDECVSRGVSVLAAAPFNSGLLASDHPAVDGRFDYRPADRAIVEQARRLARIGAGFGVRLPSAALQFPLRHPAVASVVVGLRTPVQVASAAAGIDEPIRPEAWSALLAAPAPASSEVGGHRR